MGATALEPGVCPPKALLAASGRVRELADVEAPQGFGIPRARFASNARQSPNHANQACAEYETKRNTRTNKAEGSARWAQRVAVREASGVEKVYSAEVIMPPVRTRLSPGTTPTAHVFHER